LRAWAELVGVTRYSLLRRIPILVPLALALALGTVGCHLGAPSTNTPVGDAGVTATPNATGTRPTSPTPTGTATPTSTAQVVEFTTDGAGPYLIGKTLTELQPQLQQVGPDNLCTGNTTAQGTGVWSDVRVEFHSDGKLYLLVNKSISIPTPSGAWIGQTSLTDLQTIYKGITTQVLTHGTSTAFLAQTLGGGGILFELDPTDHVSAMYAADAFYLKNTFSGGTPYC
jgi:hypothetical protein